MNRFQSHICRLATVFLFSLLLAGCMKMDVASYEVADPNVMSGTLQAVATLRSNEGIRYFQLDPLSKGWIVNPEAVADMPDVTRVFLQYIPVQDDRRPDFCTESIRVDWAMALDVGTIAAPSASYQSSISSPDPIDIVQDWITSLEDGFLTLHYMIPVSGNTKHSFTLCRGTSPYEFFLLHDARGDLDGSLTDGIVCFPVQDLLPDTGGKTVELSLNYLNLKHSNTRLTVGYKSPK